MYILILTLYQNPHLSILGGCALVLVQTMFSQLQKSVQLSLFLAQPQILVEHPRVNL